MASKCQLGAERVPELAGRAQNGGMSPRATATARAAQRSVRAPAALLSARTCYDHLAGRLGVGITEAMIRAGLLQSDGLGLTGAGRAWLAANLPLDLGSGRSNRPLTRACLDWTEQRPHLAGALGAHVCRHVIDQRWAVRTDATRALRITAAGTAALRELFGVDVVAACQG
jgi:hypothetical protein